MSDSNLPDMHDWILAGVNFDWAASIVAMRFRTAGELRTLTLSKATNLHVPKHQTWGPSVSVNKAEWASGLGDAIQTLRIEMQSGDVITVDATAFSIN